MVRKSLGSRAEERREDPSYSKPAHGAEFFGCPILRRVCERVGWQPTPSSCDCLAVRAYREEILRSVAAAFRGTKREERTGRHSDSE